MTCPKNVEALLARLVATDSIFDVANTEMDLAEKLGLESRMDLREKLMKMLGVEGALEL